RVLDGETLARRLGLLDQRRRPIRGLPNRVTTGDTAELAASLRGAFLARGKITPPGRTVSLEITCPSSETSMALVGAASRVGIDSKGREIRGVSKLLVRDGEAIGEMLAVMGADDCRAAWDELRKARETRATANRLVNF